MKTKDIKPLSLAEAVDNLTALAGLDLDHPPRLGIVREKRITTDEREPGAVFWLSGEGSENLLDLMDATYRAVYLHLLRMCEDAEHKWDNETERKGIEGLMALVGESAARLERYLELWIGGKQKGAVTERVEFQELSHIYKNSVLRKQKGTMPSREVRDLAGVISDREYELFFIRNESGEPYYTPEVLQEIQITADLDGADFEEDPLLRVRSMADRDLQATAGQIIRMCEREIRDFYKLGRKQLDHALATSIGKALIALQLAANPHHLIQNTSGKSAMQYFSDFHHYLREAMRSDEYHHLVVYQAEKGDKVAPLLMHLSHALCFALFERPGGIKQEAIGLLHRTMRKGALPLKGDTIWNQMAIQDEELRSYLAKFPSGPLFKILDLVRREEEVPFDPLGQENYPSQLFAMKSGRVLRIPCPTRQEMIQRAEIVEDFRGFLRALQERKEGLLLVNLQDRTSWREFARCQALEALQRSAEFTDVFHLLTLTKGTDFYHQSHSYEKLDNAREFCELFEAQLKGGEASGYLFPAACRGKPFELFCREMITRVHETIFDSRAKLTREERQAFIEIGYLFLVLKVMELTRAQNLSFTCKDALDTGAVASATLYGFFKMVDGGFASPEEADQFRLLAYGPALMHRERAVDSERLFRSLPALELLYSKSKVLPGLMKQFYTNF